jgi:hypothetical protein
VEKFETEYFKREPPLPEAEKQVGRDMVEGGITLFDLEENSFRPEVEKRVSYRTESYGPWALLTSGTPISQDQPPLTDPFGGRTLAPSDLIELKLSAHSLIFAFSSPQGQGPRFGSFPEWVPLDTTTASASIRSRQVNNYLSRPLPSASAANITPLRSLSFQ